MNDLKIGDKIFWPKGQEESLQWSGEIVEILENKYKVLFDIKDHFLGNIIVKPFYTLVLKDQVAISHEKTTKKTKKCTCGAAHINSSMHSTWCDSE